MVKNIYQRFCTEGRNPRFFRTCLEHSSFLSQLTRRAKETKMNLLWFGLTLLCIKVRCRLSRPRHRSQDKVRPQVVCHYISRPSRKHETYSAKSVKAKNELEYHTFSSGQKKYGAKRGEKSGWRKQTTKGCITWQAWILYTNRASTLQFVWLELWKKRQYRITFLLQSMYDTLPPQANL